MMRISRDGAETAQLDSSGEEGVRRASREGPGAKGRGPGTRAAGLTKPEADEEETAELPAFQNNLRPGTSVEQIRMRLGPRA